MSIEALQRQFATLYESEADSVFRFCLFRTSNRETALDLSQEAFLRCWDALRRGEAIRNNRAFLFTIARHLIIDWYRKKKAVSLEKIVGETADVSDFASMESLEDDAFLDADARFVLHKIEELPASYREVVLLRFVEGLPPQDIAEALGESVNVVSVRITRGLEKLRIITGFGKEAKPTKSP